jgi:hypothetical protein
MKKQLSTILSMLLILLVCSSSATAQIDPNLYGQQTQRSIWDKQPEEPKTDQPTPFGSNTQRAGTASVQQNGALADPPPFGGNTQDGIPIDGGLAFLLASGLMYGTRKMYKSTKKTKVEEPSEK